LGDADLAELKAAVDKDGPLKDEKAKQLGPSVKEWMSKMMRKVIDSSWQIELGVAGNLLSEALKAYYFQ
jgi:hypothetical protein